LFIVQSAENCGCTLDPGQPAGRLAEEIPKPDRNGRKGKNDSEIRVKKTLFIASHPYIEDVFS